MIGKTIRDFEILSELGKGGSGAVYRAHDSSVDREVAIKVILPQYANDPDFKERFDSEARLVAQLESPHIVPLYSYWHDAQGAFLVMRLVSGGNLRGIMNKQEALSLSQTIRVLSDVADALAVAHENNVVHRDLKPENILVDERGNAYLTDFGIAKRTSDSKDIAEGNVIIGTWHYLSPEQIEHDELGPQTDIYAFGILLYEMLAGQHPYHGNGSLQLVMCHLKEPMPNLKDARPDLPTQIDNIIRKATAKVSSERYASTQELIQELKQAESELSTREIHVGAIQAMQKAILPEQRNRLAMLQNVQNFWIEGVLENSLHDAAMIDLGLKPESGAVDKPWDTLIRTPSGDEHVSNEHILDVFENLNGKVLILGEPGSGKTTSLLSLARDLLLRAKIDEQYPIPVVFNLSSWSEKQPPLEEWLIEELVSKYQVPRKVGTQWVEDESLLLLLDGLDEVALDARNACVEAINNYRSEHGFVDIVVCSRIKDYEALSTQLKLNGAIIIQPLNDEQIVEYLNGLGSDVAIVHDLISQDIQLRELAQSPLMLSIMVLAYRGHTSSEIQDFDDVESQRKHLFEVYVQRMFERRGGEQSYSIEKSRHYLSWLASKMKEQARTLFQIEELQPTIITPRQRERYYRWVRATHIAVTMIFWSLLAATFAIAAELSIGIMLVTWGLFGAAAVGWFFSGDEWKYARSMVILGIPHGVGLALALYLKPDIPLPTALLLGTLVGAGVGAWAAVNSQIYFATEGDRDTIALIEKVQFKRENVTRTELLLIALVLVCISPALAGTMYVSFNLDLLRSVIGGLALASLIGTISLILVGLGFAEVSMRQTPNYGVRTTFRIVSIISIITSVSTIIGGVVLSYIMGFDPWQGFLLGVGFGVAGLGYAPWTVLGGIGVYRHWMLRRILRNHGYLPYNLAEFLDYAASLILLRKVGGGYIFIHRYLLEYFAELQSHQQEGLST